MWAYDWPHDGVVVAGGGGWGSSAELAFWLMHSTSPVGWRRESRSAALRGSRWAINTQFVTDLLEQGLGSRERNGEQWEKESLVRLALHRTSPPRCGVVWVGGRLVRRGGLCGLCLGVVRSWCGVALAEQRSAAVLLMETSCSRGC